MAFHNRSTAIKMDHNRRIRNTIDKTKQENWEDVSYWDHKPIENGKFTNSFINVRGAKLTTDHLYVARSNTYTFASKFTIAFWAKFAASTNTSVTNVLRTQYSTSDIHETTIASTMTDVVSNSTFTINLTDWNFYSIQRDTNNIVTERINGHPINQYSSTSTLDLTNKNAFIMFGNADDETSLGYDVIIDEVILLNKAVSYGTKAAPITYYKENAAGLKIL